MDKQKEIEEMAIVMPPDIISSNGSPNGQHLYLKQRIEIAEALVNADYGDVKQAVSEFAEKLEKGIYEIMIPMEYPDELDLDSDKVRDLIKKLVKEVCGE